nr:putative movement protein [Andean potato latent virus]
MSNVFSNSSRSLELHSSSRRSHQSDTELCCRASPTVPSSISMASSKRSSSLPPLFRNSQLWFGNHSPSSSNPQSNRDFSPLQPLVLPRKPTLNHNVHETPKVPKTPEPQQQLLPSLQLSANPSRHHSLPHNLHSSPNHLSRLHARRSHVLQSSSNPGSLPQLPNHQLSLLQSDRSSRIGLHRSISPTNSVPVLNLRANSPLHPGRPQRRKLQSTPACSRLAQDPQHTVSRTQPLRDQAGLLGPCPLSADPEKSPSSPSSPPVPSTTQPSKSLQQPKSRSPRFKKFERLFPTSPKCPPSTVPSSSSCTCPGILQNPRMPRASLSHFSSPTSPPPSSPTASVQCSLHLHQSCSHASHLRPCRLCQNSKQQSGILMGHPKRLGQSPNLRSHERSHSPPSVLRVLPQPLPKTETPFSSTLEKIPYPFFPCDFDFGYFTSTPTHKVTNPKDPIGVHPPQPKTTTLPLENPEPPASKEISPKKTHSKGKFLHSYPRRSWQRPSPSPQNQPISCPNSTHSSKVQNSSRSSQRPTSKSLHHSSSAGVGPNLHSQLDPSILGPPPSTNPRPVPHQHAPLPIPLAMEPSTNACRKSSTIPPLPPSSSNKSLQLSSDSSASDSSYLSAPNSTHCKSPSFRTRSTLSSRARASNRLGFLLSSSRCFSYSSDSSSSS